MIEEMIENACEWFRRQTSLTLKEAIQISLPGATKTYVLSEEVVRSTRGYHKNDPTLLRALFEGIKVSGIDVVDDCEEDIYRCIKNIDNEGRNPIMLKHAKGTINGRGKGILSELGVQDGVLGENYQGIRVFKALLKQHNL